MDDQTLLEMELAGLGYSGQLTLDGVEAGPHGASCAGSTPADGVACSETSKDVSKVSGGRSLPAVSDIPSPCETSQGNRPRTAKQTRKAASFSYDARKRPQKSKVDVTKSSEGQFLSPPVAGEVTEGERPWTERLFIPLKRKATKPKASTKAARRAVRADHSFVATSSSGDSDAEVQSTSPLPRHGTMAAETEELAEAMEMELVEEESAPASLITGRGCQVTEQRMNEQRRNVEGSSRTSACASMSRYIRCDASEITSNESAADGAPSNSVASNSTSVRSSQSAAIGKAHSKLNANGAPRSGGPTWVLEKQNLAQNQRLQLMRAASSSLDAVHEEEDKHATGPLPPPPTTSSATWVSEKGNFAHSQRLLQARAASSQGGMCRHQRALGMGGTIREEEKEEGTGQAAASHSPKGWCSEKIAAVRGTARSVASSTYYAGSSRRDAKSARAFGSSLDTIGKAGDLGDANVGTHPPESSSSLSSSSGPARMLAKQNLAGTQRPLHRGATSFSQGAVHEEEEQEQDRPHPPPLSAADSVWVSEKGNLAQSQRLQQTRRVASSRSGTRSFQRTSSSGETIQEEEKKECSDGSTQVAGAEASAEPVERSTFCAAPQTDLITPPAFVTPPAPIGAQPHSQPRHLPQQPAVALDDTVPGAVYVRGRGTGVSPPSTPGPPLRRMTSLLGSISSATTPGRDIVAEVAAELAPGEEVAVEGECGPLRSRTTSAARGWYAVRRSLVLEGVPVPSRAEGGQHTVSDGGKGCGACPSRRCAKLLCAAIVVFAVAMAVMMVLLGARPGSSVAFGGRPRSRPEPDPILEIVSRLSSAEVLSNTQSPQRRAIRWLMEEDSAFSSSALNDDPARLLQRYALVVLYYSTGGPHWRHQLNFLSSDHECEWNEVVEDMWRKGVMFCNNNSQVVAIHLNSNHLTGTLPGAELAAFPSLERLRMPDNNLDGTIPSELASLKSLQRIELRKNGLTGPIIEGIGDLQNLLHIDIGENKLNSTIPLSMGYLKALEYLSLDENMLSKDIPSTIGNMSSLKILNLNFNHFSSTLPLSWHTLAKLERLHIMGNNLNGTLPFIPTGNQNLMQLVAGDNHFTGTVPTLLGALPRLTLLLLENNKLHGSIPESLSNLMELEVLSLGSNNLTGTISAAIFRSGTLRAIGVGNNKLAGTLPNDIGNPSGMLVVSAEQNLLTGTIPWTYGNLPALNALSLHSNLLSGAIPSSLGNNTESLGLMLENNMLNGTVPESLVKLEKAFWISLARNDLTGNLSFVCAPELSNAQLVTADCEPPDVEVSCDCCICCNDAMGGCDFSLDVEAYVLSCLVDGSCDFWG